MVRGLKKSYQRPHFEAAISYKPSQVRYKRLSGDALLLAEDRDHHKVGRAHAGGRKTPRDRNLIVDGRGALSAARTGGDQLCGPGSLCSLVTPSQAGLQIRLEHISGRPETRITIHPGA